MYVCICTYADISKAVYLYLYVDPYRKLYSTFDFRPLVNKIFIFVSLQISKCILNSIFWKLNWAVFLFQKHLIHSFILFNSTNTNYCLLCNMLGLVMDGKHCHRGEEQEGGGSASELAGLIMYSRGHRSHFWVFRILSKPSWNFSRDFPLQKFYPHCY